MNQAELCRLAELSSDQLEAIGAVYKKIDDCNTWGWALPDGSRVTHVMGVGFVELKRIV